jgi:hypothetical protein
MDNKRQLLALGLIGLGGLFLMSRIFSFDIAAWMWPWFIIVPGLPFLWLATTQHDKASSGLIFPGVLITGTGGLLLYQSITGHWESWIYAWLMYPVLIGFGLKFQGTRNGNQAEAAVGRVMMMVSAFFLVSCGLMFEILFFSGLSGWVWPLILIVLGLALLNGCEDDNDEAIITPKRKNDDKNKNDDRPTLRERIDAALNEDEDGGPIIV